MRKTLCLLLILCLTLAGAAAALAEENLLLNGDFSEIIDGMPAHWQTDAWQRGDGASEFSVTEDGFEGTAAGIVNRSANDARFTQTVAVEPDTLYRISGMIRAQGCSPEDLGATLSVAGVYAYSDPVYDTEGSWQHMELYGLTGPDQTSLTVFARLGGYSSTNTGSAWFDNLEMIRLDEAPEDADVQVFYTENDSSSDSESGAGEDGVPKRYTESLLLFACLYVVAVMGFARKRNRGATPLREPHLTAGFIVALVGAMLIRLIVAARVRGYHVDISCFSAWSERIYARGPLDFYAPDYFCDYPPGYMLLLWPVAMLRDLLGVGTDSAVYLILLKLLPMLMDIAGALLIWTVARKRLSERSAILLSLLYAFNPAAIANSAAWGQIDSVLALLIALCALSAVDGRYVRALVFFALALLIKPQALLFGPLGLAAIVIDICRAPKQDQLRRLKTLGAAVAACLGILYAVAFLFCFKQADDFFGKLVRPVAWLVELTFGTTNGYPYMTVNTLNLHYLLRLNWQRMADHPAASAIAWILFALSYGYAIAMLAFGAKKPRRLFLTGGLLIVLVCCFGPMMHERYIFPGMLLLALAFASERDRRILISLTALTATLLMNELLVLQGGMTTANYGHLQDSERWLNNLLSAVNVTNALFLAWTAFDICVRGHAWQMRPLPREEVPVVERTLTEPANYRMGLKRLDALLMGAVTVLYSVVAFTNLGTTNTPQTGWTSSAAGESVVFDLGEVRTWRMTFFNGTLESPLALELSNDGEHWSEQCAPESTRNEMFRWYWYVAKNPMGGLSNEAIYEGSESDERASKDDVPQFAYPEGFTDSRPMQTSRYVRLTAQAKDITLFEVGFLDEEGNALPIKSVSQSGQDADAATSAALLIDEQGTVAAYPSYLNSTYFDEIYHARTAYEQLHAIPAYEWTHPPLGKATMELGILLFGMSPFGWRFMGTLFGVMMVPLMYLMVKQLTKSTHLSFIAMCLMALDSMHFTQTRIATIDSYAVFWIMLMYLFMIRYCQMSWNRESLGRTLVPLGLCGVTMGIAWATKWIGIYASAGLAILFFWTVFCRIRENLRMRRAERSWRKLFITLGFCVAFFVVIPALIYYISYAFQLHGEGVNSLWDMFELSPVEEGGSFRDMFVGTRFQRVYELQKSIFGYHAGLGGDTHYFRSPWYQWPVIAWPMWYYSGTDHMPNGVISSISCMGNPAVWWFGLAAIIFVLIRMCWMRRAPRSYVIVIVAFASQYLPWVIVPRSTFIYHYFASVPFIIIASVLLLDYIRGRSPKAYKITAWALLGAALVLFAAFYPLESGMPVSRAYANYLRWFNWYNF